MMYGSKLTQIYIKKVLALPKPHLTEKLRSAIGVFIYIARYLFRFAYFVYWLNRLVNMFKNQTHIIWSDEANQAWDALMFLVQNSPILFTPTIDGQFCVKSDACLYAIGAVLYQLQESESGQRLWRIIDMQVH